MKNPTITPEIIPTCPRYQSTHVVRNGKTKAGSMVQHRFCKFLG